MNNSTKLAQALKAFYFKKGRKFVFRTGQNLSELALDMWEELGFKSFDQGTLSKVLNGKRLFTWSQFNAFCNQMGASGTERQQLRNVMAYDLYLLEGLDFDPAADVSLNLFEQDLTEVRKQRTRGSIPFANYHAAIALQRMEEIASSVVSDTLRASIRRIHALIGFESEIINRVRLQPGAELMHRGIELFDELMYLADTGVDSKLAGLANYSNADLYHVLGWFDAAISWSDLTLQTLSTDNMDLPVQLRRARLVDKAHLGDIDGVEAEKLEIAKLIDTGDLSNDQLFILHEGLTRAKLIVGDESAFLSMEEARSNLRAAGDEKQPIREFQRIRTELELIKEFDREVDEELEREARAAIAEAGRQHCFRFRSEIELLLNHALKKQRRPPHA
ncbi:MAG TPA: hypothetical protein VGE45_18785 [Chloroflexia bacterium]|jgi:hypothetical protein